MRVCQFRHDGKSGLQCSGGREAAVSGRSTFLFYSAVAGCQTSPLPRGHRDTEKIFLEFYASPARALPKSMARSPFYASFAVIEISAFSTFDTGQPFSAASAYF